MNEFVVDPRLIASSHFICDLDLCRLFLNDNSLFPWVILIPKRVNISEIIDLPIEDQATLMHETALISNVLKELFKPDKLNVAALGNIVPQLHVHIIARYADDSAWPGAPFGCKRLEYEEGHRVEFIGHIREATEKYKKKI